jgi:hypothetical protein
MANITIIDDVDIERRPTPAAVGGDFRDSNSDSSNADLAIDATQFWAGVNGVKGATYTHRAYLYFDLLKYIPPDATITAAYWHFYVATTDATAAQAFHIDRLRKTVVEDEGTWNDYKSGDNGTASGGGNNYLDDSSKSWTTNEWQNDTVAILSGTGAGQERVIASNTGTRLTVSVNWTTNPDATSVYRINGWATAGAYNTTYDIDTSVTKTLGTLETTGWKALDILTMVSDAWSTRSGICQFLMTRTSAPTTLGMVTIHAKNYYATDPALVHHLRITYTLAGKTFQVFVFDGDVGAAAVRRRLAQVI